MPYAKNKDAVAVCNRSGQKMYRKDMVEDGYLRGLLVHPDWYDPPHPQEQPFDPEEGIAIYKPAPDLMPTPPAPVLSAGTRTSSSIVLNWTQQDPPGSTIIRWDVWRQSAGTTNFVRIATAAPVIPTAFFIQGPDQLPGDTTTVTGQMYTDTNAQIGNQYYVVAVTADTSIEHSDGLSSAPSNIISLSQSSTQIFNQAGVFTWNKDPFAVKIDLSVIAGGGGGGAAIIQNIGTGGGGSGGGGGERGFGTGINASLVAAAVTVTVGLGGIGAANSGFFGGANGSQSSFGTYLICNGGQGGRTNPGGGNIGGAGGTGGTTTLPGITLVDGGAGGAGDSSSNTAINAANTTNSPSGGGGNDRTGHGGGTGGNVGALVNGGQPGTNAIQFNPPNPGTLIAGNGANGGTSTDGNFIGSGAGGGGTAYYGQSGCNIGVGGNGGNGGLGGGGGGGGGYCGGCLNVSGGAGGNGGQGVVVVTTWFF